MGLASQETVFLFNYRAHRDRDVLDKLVFMSGRRGDGSQTKDGVRALHSILKDAIENHSKKRGKPTWLPKNVKNGGTERSLPQSCLPFQL